ncbi:hypothetical protein QAD02_012544 [Eretmocerus hayati]|uniref:Uncharacterized protein n=1 Tax=Eretmocerus hayati TaxID=131215 RepID=A0ACC2P045_9HYME|nr:hypothetical protein QAD02_012544 [Eretmocerus hayati]
MSYFFGTTSVNSRLLGSTKQKREKQCIRLNTSSKPNRSSRSKHCSSHQNIQINSRKSMLQSDLALRRSTSDGVEHGYLMLEGTSNHDRFNKTAHSKKEYCITTAQIGSGKSQKDKKSHEELSYKIRKKYRKLEQNSRKKQAKIDKLHTLCFRQKDEIRQLHSQCKSISAILEQEKSSNLRASQTMRDENIQLNRDLHLLKNLVFHLNTQIEKYQDRLRSSNMPGVYQTNAAATPDAISNRAGFDSHEIERSWKRVNFHILGPLLHAYQESLSEKDQLIQSYEENIADITRGLKEVIAENEDLYEKLENSEMQVKKTIEEMKIFQNDALTIKEHNQLLQKHLATEKQKLRDIFAVYQEEIELATQNIDRLNEEHRKDRFELDKLSILNQTLTEAHEKLKIESGKTLPLSVHDLAIEEYKKLFDELENRHGNEKKKLAHQLESFQKRVPHLEKKVSTMTTERTQWVARLRILEKIVSQTQAKQDHLQRKLEAIRISRNSLKDQLKKTTLHCEELLKKQSEIMNERRKDIQTLEEKELENKNIKHLSDDIAHRMAILKDQLKIIQGEVKGQLASIETYITNQEIGMDQMKIEYRREVQRLKSLLHEKENLIQKLQREKNVTEDNLELVWKAAVENEGR